ncbi:non-ribosomal peptide synthetase [Actinacidiphila soli]|uniref:non-ribosomal peptide synthetase n=1 Tax=Actinacidiphila soli TaxID=2487275 RepID=UPI0013E2B65E|nr:non-ribosomal peptide synthetase [Actinacidiphila soli]
MTAATNGMSSAVKAGTRPMPDAYEYGDRIDRVVVFHAEREPTSIALQQDGRKLTYGELVGQSAAFAGQLKDMGIGPGSFVPTAMVRSPELVMALLGIMMAGAAYIPMDPAWPQERTASVLERSGARFVVCDDRPPHRGAAHYLLFPSSAGHGAGLPAAGGPPRTVGYGSDAANVLFTSGSTGEPKGVVTPHRGTVRALVNVPAIPLGATTTFLQAAPVPWDGFSLELWGALLNGGRCVLMERDRVTADASALRAGIDAGVNTVLLTSSLFSVIADEDPDAFADLDLVLVGGERASTPHIRTVLKRFPALRMVNAYGPAEASIIAAAHPIRPQDVAEGTTEIPIGAALPRTSVDVVTEDGRPVVPGQQGEIVVGGDGVALGYLNDPDETSRRFFQAPGPRSAAGRYYRTGDMAVVDTEGNLRYRGRTDRQFKVHGIRIEPGEVESVLESHPHITACCAVRVDRTPWGAEVACVYTTADGRPLAEPDVRAFASRRLLPAMVPAAFLHVPKLPTRSTGKVDGVAVAAYVREHQHATAASAPDATAPDPLVTEAREILGMPSLSPDLDVVTAGARSLDIVRLAARLSARLGTPVSAGDIYRLRSIDKLRAAGARSSVPAPPPVFSGADQEAVGPLSHAQRRFLFSEMMSPGDADNLVVTAYELSGPLDMRVLRGALRDVVARHPILRTVYESQNGLPVQRVLPPEEAPVVLEEVSPPPIHTRADVHLIAQRVTADWWDAPPFLLHRDIPIRGRISALGHGRHLLGLCIHHIAFDGWSEDLFLRDLSSAYNARLAGREQPAGGGPSYLRYTHWEHSQLDQWYETDVPFWTQTLSSASAKPFLPAPKAKGDAPRFEISRRLDARTVNRLVAVARQGGGPPVAVLLGAVAEAMHRVFGVANLCLGTVTAGRFETGLEQLVGYFVNPFAVPLTSVGHRSADTAVRASAMSVVSGLQHSRTPFDELVRVLRPDRQRHPWFQSWVILQQKQSQVLLGEHTTMAPVRVAPPRTGAEWMLQAFPDGSGRWEIVTHWRTDALDESTAAAVADQAFSALRSWAR